VWSRFARRISVASEEKMLQKELVVFEQNKQEWLLSHTGHFVVISGVTVAGFYPDYESAFMAGLEKFGIQGSFLVKQVWAEEPVYLIH
jgi:hypothetical protein